jgi:hypothetical protein
MGYFERVCVLWSLECVCWVCAGVVCGQYHNNMCLVGVGVSCVYICVCVRSGFVCVRRPMTPRSLQA